MKRYLFFIAYLLGAVSLPSHAQSPKYVYAFDAEAIPVAYAFRDLSRSETVDSVCLRIFYEFTAPDVTPEQLRDRMVLDIGMHYADYYSHAERHVDSLCTAREGVAPNTVNPYSGREQILIDRTKDRAVCCNRTPFALSTVFVYEDAEVPEWELTHLRDTIAGYSCHAAETTFRGRRWRAWFSTEIPIELGPWKLHGLPGLILGAEDAEGTFRWRCVGMTRPRAAIRRYDWAQVRLTRTKWRKMERNIFRNPCAYAASLNIMLRRYVDDRSEPVEAAEIPWHPLELE